jgi:ribonucleoside-diphosphate reductase alpha chain
MNLLNFVDNPFTEKALYNFKNFSDAVIVAQRLMDDMIDLELEKVNLIINKIKSDPESEDVKSIELKLWENIKNACQNGRRTGLGITALGDTIAALGVKYGSEESIKITEEIYKTLALNSYKSSIIMAKERGSFSIWNLELEKNHPFLDRILNELDDDTLKMYKQYGRRNIANTTTAPTGSVSIMTQTTSGIEPAFLVKYTRRKKISENEKHIKPDFVDAMGDKWQEFEVYHHQFKKWMEITGKNKVDESPYHNAMANDINWVNGVKIQSVAQKWIDHSISKTCCLPNSVTKEQVAEVYMAAWEHKCKGFTVYRDGCRDGVLVSTTKKETSNKILKTNAPKRPKELPCDIHHVKIVKKLDKIRSLEYIVIVGLLNDDPYEIFVFENSALDKKYTNAILVKKSRGKYSIKLDENVEIEDIMKNQTEEEEMITRLASTALRHGTDISFLVHQLEKVKGDHIGSFTKVMGRTLKKYIKDGTKISGSKCPECGQESLIRENGCTICKNCGNSKCG